jgi:hypothetical protein
MRAVVWMLLASSLASCSDSPASPSSASAGFPNIIGTWLGSRTEDAHVAGGATVHSECAERWTVLTQNNASFAGTYETGGSASAGCSQQAGSIEGTVTATGTIATFSSTPVLGILKACVVSGQTALTGGVLSGAINLRFSDQVTCSSGPGTFETTSRTVSVALVRQ